MKPLTRHTLHLTPLSPLHLGTGEDYEPTNYLIHGDALYTFDPARAILNPDEERELHTAAQSGDLQHIQRYFRNNPKPYIVAATHASSVSKGIAAEYQKNYGEIVQREGKRKNVHNRFQIERTATNPHNHQPYIPGSALKGSLRTALLEQLSGKKPPQGPLKTQKDQARYENELLGSFATDLLRLLKPADLSAAALSAAAPIATPPTTKNASSKAGNAATARPAAAKPSSTANIAPSTATSPCNTSTSPTNRTSKTLPKNCPLRTASTSPPSPAPQTPTTCAASRGKPPCSANAASWTPPG